MFDRTGCLSAFGQEVIAKIPAINEVFDIKKVPIFNLKSYPFVVIRNSIGLQLLNVNTGRIDNLSVDHYISSDQERL